MAFPDIPTERVQTYHEKLLRRDAVALSKARVRQIVVANPYVVGAFKSGAHDLGVYTGDGILPSNATHRLLHMFENHKDDRCIVPIVVTEITCKLENQQFQWSFKLTETQSIFGQVVILTTRAEPDFVVLFPLHFFQAKNESGTGRARRYVKSLKEPSTGFSRSPPAFAPEWNPFVLRMVDLDRALMNVRDYVKGAVQQWSNAWTGVVYTGAPAPTVHTMATLEMVLTKDKAALPLIKHLFNAFREHSKAFTVEFVGVPENGDCKLVTSSKDLEVIVNLYVNHYRVVQDPETKDSHLEHHQRILEGAGNRLIFSWRSQWDYMLTVDSAHSEAYFIPRDSIPDSWWNVLPSHEHDSPMLSTPPGSWMDTFRVRFGNALNTVQDMERVFASFPQKATKEIPMAPTARWELREGAVRDFEE